MVRARHPRLACIFVIAGSVLATCVAGAAQAQDVSKEVFDCGAGACVVLEGGPSFSDISLNARVDTQKVDKTTGAGLRAIVDFTLTQPFKSSAAGAGVNAVGLGSVRSVQVGVTLTSLPPFDPENPAGDEGASSFSLSAWSALSHRRVYSGDQSPTDRVDRFGYAFGLGLSWLPPDRGPFPGIKLGAGIQYRRQYLPAVIDGTPVDVASLIVRGSVAGALKTAPGFADGLGYELSAAYDIKRHIPGAQLALTTKISEHPWVVVGLRGWLQGRDDDPRTQDDRWDAGPQLKIKF